MTAALVVKTTEPPVFRTILIGWLLKLSNSSGKIKKKKLPARISVFTSKNKVVKMLENDGWFKFVNYKSVIETIPSIYSCIDC